MITEKEMRLNNILWDTQVMARAVVACHTAKAKEGNAELKRLRYDAANRVFRNLHTDLATDSDKVHNLRWSLRDPAFHGPVLVHDESIEHVEEWHQAKWWREIVDHAKRASGQTKN